MGDVLYIPLETSDVNGPFYSPLCERLNCIIIFVLSKSFVMYINSLLMDLIGLLISYCTSYELK